MSLLVFLNISNNLVKTRCRWNGRNANVNGSF